ncbi:MAG: YhdP family protein [Alphaproteobacteria bacterium]|nr:YhdP family protein [Alphaproteobacteria bacterium]
MLAIQMPERWVALYARVAGWLFWGLASGWVLLLALWMALHWIIVPRIDQFRPWLQERASLAMGIRVELGQLSGNTRGLVTEFQLDNVRLLDAQGLAQMELRQVNLALTPTSALQGVFSQISLDGLDLEIERDDLGRIRIAGIDVLEGAHDNRLRNWVFSQWEWVLRQSRIRWTDRMGSGETVAIDDIDGLLRNGLRVHQFRLDGNPDPSLGDRFSLRGRFRQPLLSTQSGLWEEWSGQAYVQAGRIDWAALMPLLPMPEALRLDRGQGWVRAWADLRTGQLASWSADLGLSSVQASLTAMGSVPTTIKLDSVAGRLGWSGGEEEKWTFEQWAWQTQQAPQGRLSRASLELQRSSQGAILGGQAQIDHLDLNNLQPWMAWAPMVWQTHWDQAQPQGRLRQAQWRWSGPVEAMRVLSWQASADGLAWQSGPIGSGTKWATWPGLMGLDLELEGKGLEVKGKVNVRSGTLSWPGFWEEARHDIQSFRSDVSLTDGPNGRRLQLKSAHLQTGDAQADFNLSWIHSPSDPLGRIDLVGDVPQAQAHQVLRWLPMTLPDSFRQYLKQALPQGEVRQTHVRVLGRLDEFPFKKPGSGDFRISSQLSKVRFLSAPRLLMDAKTVGEWPVFQDLSGELVFERNSMRLSKVKTRLAQAPAITWPVLEAQIKNLGQAVVEIRAEGKGPLNEALSLWKSSPLNEMTERVLDGAKAQGMADFKMSLSIPIQRPEQTGIKGTVTLSGNEFTMAPATPTLSRARGIVAFTQEGFDLQGMQAQLWGGELRLEGGAKARPPAGSAQAQIRAQGLLTAAGLREAPELNEWASHLKRIQGNAQYNAQLQWRRGQLEAQVHSDLVGMAIQAPAGLGKSQAQAMPLRWDNSLSPESTLSGPMLEQMSLRMGSELEARFVRDLSGSKPKVLRGLIRWGNSTAPPQMPAQGVTLRLNVDAINLSEWTDWMQPFTGTSESGDGVWDYAPQRIDFQAAQVLAQGRRLNQVRLNAQRNQDMWRGQMSSQELEGELHYQPAKGPDMARLQARLVRLTVPASATIDHDLLLDGGLQDLPTLDIQVKDLDLRGKRLGALELLAQNRSRPDGANEWQLSKLQIVNDDAEFKAEGVWRKSPARAASQTQLDFRLNIKNAGDLLQRLGLPDAVRNGQGSIEGQVGWSGSPVAPDLNSMAGQFNVEIERGRFLKSEPGAARLLGVLSLQSLPRRLMLDFRDVFSEGFAFDFFRGNVKIDRGVASSNNLQMKGVNVAVLMEGQTNIAQETQDLKIMVIPDINAGGASLVYSAINPVVGLTTFIAQYVLRRPLSESNTQQFHIDGTWSEPRVTQVPFKSVAKP